jgi:hypothetical protein
LFAVGQTVLHFFVSFDFGLPQMVKASLAVGQTVKLSAVRSQWSMGTMVFIHARIWDCFWNFGRGKNCRDSGRRVEIFGRDFLPPVIRGDFCSAFLNF